MWPTRSDFPQVRYEVSGSGVAEAINYQLDTGQKHIVNVPLPWSTQFTSFGGQVFVLSAEGDGQISLQHRGRRQLGVQGDSLGDPGAGGLFALSRD